MPGTRLPAADALSRCPNHIPLNDDDNKDITLLPDEKFIAVIDIDTQESITTSKKYDPLSTTMFKALLAQKPELVDKRYSIYPTNHRPLLLFKNRVVIPDDYILHHDIIR